MQFRVLGPVELLDGQRQIALGGGRQRKLLLALLIHANEVVSSDRLIEALWGERPPASSAKLVQGFVSKLRRVLGDGRLETRAPGYVLRVDKGELDVDRFEALVAEARTVPPNRAAELLREALSLWRGPPLPELRYADIAQPEIARLESLRHVALEERFEADLALGRHRELVPELERLVAAEPLRERLRAQLMLALYGSDRQADALASYADGRRRFVEELGIEPGAALKELERQILAQDAALELEPSKTGAEPVPAPFLASVDRLPGNLPTLSTPFLGRTRELGEVVELLSRRDVRLLTLTGPGGSGKTRLAAHAAADLAGRYPHGVWWVPLAALRDAELVLGAAAQSLGVRGDLSAQIAERSLLLVFDNFEQVVDAAQEVAGLLTACPGLDLLVTSREPLHVTGERQYPVPPLLPEEGIDFFLARARAVEPGLEADETETAEICRRLDDLPLALELAAARVKALSLAQIRERLERRLPLLTDGARDLPRRQQTLQATIEWSYELLGEAERRLFARLSVFAGGCELEAAEAVTEADLDTLQSLVEKNLLRHRGERYSMLETIREFARARLEQSAEAEELNRRHAELFFALAEEAEPRLRTDDKEWLDRVEAEHDNLRAALDWLAARGETQRVLRLAGALSRFWYVRGHGAEGRHRIENALAADDGPSAARAAALNHAAIFAIEGADVAAVKARAEEGLELHRRLEDAWGVAHSGFLLAHAVTDAGDAAVGRELFAESLRQFRNLGDEHYALLARFNLAMLIQDLGDPEQARALHDENLRDAGEQADERITAMSLDQLAQYMFDEGRAEDALSMLKQSLRVRRDLGDHPMIAENLGRLAHLLANTGQAIAAARLLSSSEALREQIGSNSTPTTAKRNVETLSTIRGLIGDEGLAEAWDQGRALTLDETVACALASSAAAAASPS
ncbi:MAG: BTAD domain-containing putative transcriptional regulator [Gaiellaceae bacterium]